MMKQSMTESLEAIWEFPLLNFAHAGTVQSACLLQMIAEHTGLRPLGQFPRGSVPGLWNR